MCSLPLETLISLLVSSCGRGALAALLRWCSGVAVPGRCVGTAACPLSCLRSRPTFYAFGSSRRRKVRRGEQVRGGRPSPLPSVIRSLQECAGVWRHFILNHAVALYAFRRCLCLRISVGVVNRLSWQCCGSRKKSERFSFCQVSK